jgi:4-oxalocrotonate tautomerase
MPIIEVRHATTYGTEKKREIVRAVTDAYSQASGTPVEKVWVLLTEVDRESWGTGGQTLASKDAV